MERLNLESSGDVYSMPGPQFPENNSNEPWWRRHSQKIVLAAIVVLVALGGFSFYKSYQQRKALLKPALENLTPAPSPNTSPALAQFQVTGKSESKPAEKSPLVSKTPEVRKTDGHINAKAAKGNGATHLARYALKEYLKDKPELANQLKVEQKIYIEDYLRKHVDKLPRTLKVGDEISFSEDLIKIAIGESQKLTDKQLKNLQKYVPLVPSLQNP
jgi:hypothetical protein